eukprot:5895010-Amphidinium_carterae.2
MVPHCAVKHHPTLSVPVTSSDRVQSFEGFQAAVVSAGTGLSRVVILHQVVKVFMESNRLQETTSILLDALKANKPEQVLGCPLSWISIHAACNHTSLDAGIVRSLLLQLY